MIKQNLMTDAPSKQYLFLTLIFTNGVAND
jgi:hypothetical protein